MRPRIVGIPVEDVAAVDEDVDIIALSDHTGSMPIIAAAVLEELKKRDAIDIHIMAGGLISPEDATALDKLGVSGNYGPGTDLDLIVQQTANRRLNELFNNCPPSHPPGKGAGTHKTRQPKFLLLFVK